MREEAQKSHLKKIGGSRQKNSKISKKVLDKQNKMCYNKGVPKEGTKKIIDKDSR